jgi:hypothetical protein
VSTRAPLVALISATPAAIPPAVAAFDRIFPAAVLWNLLDDRLLTDADERGGLDDELRARMTRLIAHAEAGGAAGVLLTCSLYAPLAHDRARDAALVLAPDDASFERVAELAPKRIVVVASLPNPLEDTCRRLRAAMEGRGLSVDVTGVLADGAFDAAAAGDAERLYESVSTALDEQRGLEGVPVLLAQYSLATTADALASRLGVPVISGPDAAAALLLNRLSESEDGS